MSALSTFLRCQRKYYYQEVKGLIPLSGGSSEAMTMGTIFHEALASIYGAQKTCPDAGFDAMFGHQRIDQIVERGYTEHHGERQSFELADDKVQLLHDMLDLYWNELGSKDQFDAIIAVEEPFILEIGGYAIRNTFDLVVREKGQIVVYDHKTVGSIKETLEFLPLDFQIGAYMLAAYKHFGEPVEFVYNMVRRAKPGGKTGRASTAIGDYLRRERLWKSESELAEWEKILNNLVVSVEVRGAFGRNAAYQRSPQKGYMGGCNSCVYKSVCSAELSGHTMSDDMLSMSYRKRENIDTKEVIIT